MGWLIGLALAGVLVFTTRTQREWFLNKRGLVRDAIEAWRPGELDNEKEFERHLKSHLQKVLAPHKVQTQFGIARTRADFAINGEVLIELKVDINSTAKLHRLVGQIDDYMKASDCTFVIVCGASDDDLIHDLMQKYETESRVEVIVKRSQGFEK